MNKEVPVEFIELAQRVYVGSDGWLYWLDIPENKHRVKGRRIGGGIKKDCYPQIGLGADPQHTKIPVHCFMFWLHHGYLPEMVDHINRDKSDYRIDNLRATTRQLNRVNSKNNKLGVRKRYKADGSYIFEVSQMFNRKRYHIGYFKDEANANYAAWQIKQWFFPGYADMPAILKRILNTGSRNNGNP